MSSITGITTGLAAIDSALASVGHASFASLGGAIDTALQDIKGAAATSAEQTALDIASAAFPQLGTLIGVIEAVHTAFPQIRGADWGDPVRRAQDESPYAGNGPMDASQGE
jgi:hypothetical protein